MNEMNADVAEDPRLKGELPIGSGAGDFSKGAPAPKIPPVQVPTTSEPSSGVGSQKKT